MIPLRWHLGRYARVLGWQGLIGLGLAGAAATLYVVGVSPATARLTQLQQEALSVRDFARTAGGDSNVARPAQDIWLEKFYRLLPVKSSAPDWLRIIFSAARAQSLGLEQGDYRLKIEKNGRLAAYEIGLPVRGTYVQMRRFIAEVLDGIPAVALDEFVIKRETIGDPAIEASIRFTLFLNGS